MGTWHLTWIGNSHRVISEHMCTSTVRQRCSASVRGGRGCAFGRKALGHLDIKAYVFKGSA